MINPFDTFMTKDLPILIGRDDLVKELLAGVTESQPVSYQIIGFRTFGATTLLRYLWHPEGALAKRGLTRRIHAPFDNSDQLIFLYVDCVQFQEHQDFAEWLYGKMVQDERLKRFLPENFKYTGLKDIQEILLRTGQEQHRIVFLLDHFDLALKRVDTDEAANLRSLVGLAAFITATEKHIVEIQKDTASSWFGGQLFAINLVPITKEDAFILLEEASKANRHSQPIRDIKEYNRLIQHTGCYPYYILKGASYWYELRQRYGQMPEKDLLEFWTNRLLTTKGFHRDFVRFWNYISESQTQKSSLIKLVSLEGRDNLSLSDQTELNSLMDVGLVIWEGGHYKPFSQLWRDFIRQKIVEDDVHKETSAISTAKVFTKREEELLSYLQLNQEKICPYEEILMHVWYKQDSEENRHTLRQIILRLRRKMARVGDEGYIINHRNRGYEYRDDAQKNR